MKLEQNDLSLLFSNTNLPDVFFTEYLSQTSGDFIKIYLHILFLSKYGKDVKINDMSKKLNLDFKTIQDGIKYWEDLGVITKKNTGYIMNSLQEIELHKLYKPKVALSAEDMKKTEENQYRAKAIEGINNQFFQGTMSPSWYSDIYLWFKKYDFDESVMISLFQYCYNHSALHRNYIQAVADDWHKNHVKNMNDLDDLFAKQDKLNILYKAIVKKLGYTRTLNEYEKGFIQKWSIEYGYSLEIIELALKKSTSKANVGFDYFNAILKDWFEHGLKTYDDIMKYQEESKQKNKNIKKLEKSTGYNSYNQRKYDNLNSLYANLD